MERLIKKLSMTCRSHLDEETDKRKQKELQEKINGKVGRPEGIKMPLECLTFSVHPVYGEQRGAGVLSGDRCPFSLVNGNTAAVLEVPYTCIGQMSSLIILWFCGTAEIQGIHLLY